MGIGWTLAIVVSAAVVVAVGSALLRRAQEPAAPPAGRWNTDAITPAGAEPRSRVLERVAQQGVLVQGVLVACEMAHADGAFDPHEQDTIRAFILSHVPGSDEAFARRILREALAERADHVTLGSAVETIRAVGSEEQRELILELLVEVARADGAIHEQERAFMRQVGADLGLEPAAVAARLEG